MTIGYEKFAISGLLAFEESPLSGPVARLTMGGAVATVALQGAQVLGWTPSGATPVIWLSPSERLDTGKPVRGGIPICWPWFATHPTDPAKPAHGFVRTRLWQVAGTRSDAMSVTLTLITATTDADRALWPHKARAKVDVVLTTGSLDVRLTTENIGHSDFALTDALHTYFAVADITRVQVEGFDDHAYLDKVDANARKHWKGPIRFDGEVDRIYLGHGGQAVIVDEVLRRRIHVMKTGSRSSVVWNPWVEKCRRLGDMGPDGYKQMVCVETANAGEDIVTVVPGARHVLGTTYFLRPV